MAFPIQITLGLGNKVSLNYQSQEVNVSVTYQLERDETDLLAVAKEKAGEVKAAHNIAWAQVRGEKDPTEDTAQAASSEIETVAAEKEAGDTVSQLPSLPLSCGQKNALEALFAQAGWSLNGIEDHLLEQFGKAEIGKLTTLQAARLLLELQRDGREQAQHKVQGAKTVGAIGSGVTLNASST